ncbi:hypothetical protein [Kribbella sp. NPDC048928]|uniref:hypothetical protein n=1 Tax=Kribbella sp. NPDC048928 TaxID=3364111 RepID=UPI00371039A5
MQTAIKRTAVLMFTSALAVSVLSGITPATAATTSTCVATELRLPAGTPTEVFASLGASDPTARYQVGFIQNSPRNIPLFWTDGEPQVLEQSSAAETSLIDVNSHGTVLGTTGPYGDSQAWLYSNGTFRNLPQPKDVSSIIVRAMNERGDVVGYGYDNAARRSVVIVWPGHGSTPIRLRAGDSAIASDINDNGVVIGELSTEAGTRGIVWTRWDRNGKVVGDAGVALTHITGDWTVGVRSNSDGSVTGVRWHLGDPAPTSFPHILDSVNGSGDVAYTTDEGTAAVERPDGTSYLIDAVGYNTAYHLFERGSKYDAAGDRDYGWSRAVLWSGCSS